MSLRASRRLLSFKLVRINKYHKRTILSSSYGCDKPWNDRLNQPLLAKIQPDAFFSELNSRYTKKLKVGAVDIDIFANVISKEDQLDELEHLLLKLRKSRRTKDTLESTHHAVCRTFLSSDALDRLLNIASKRTEYGVFPDYFCYNIMIDKYIESNNFRDAAKVAVLAMLQEEFDNPITNRLSLYAMYKYFSDSNRSVWVDESGNNESSTTEDSEGKENNEDDNDEEEEEIEYVRVPRIRNPFNDEHFDLTEPCHIWGKTLNSFGKQFDDIAGRSCQILGLALFSKWAMVSKLLQKLKPNNSSDKLFTQDAISHIEALVADMADENEEKQTASNILKELSEMSDRFSSEKSLETLLTEKLSEIPALEEQDKQTLLGKYAQWETDRENALKRQLDELLRDERIKEIEAKRHELEEREQLLFFFENQNKHEIDLTEAEQLTEKYSSRNQVEEEYVPPTV